MTRNPSNLISKQRIFYKIVTSNDSHGHYPLPDDHIVSDERRALCVRLLNLLFRNINEHSFNWKSTNRRTSSARRAQKAPWTLTSGSELTTNVEGGPQACDYRGGLEHGSPLNQKLCLLRRRPFLHSTPGLDSCWHCTKIPPPSHAPFPLMDWDSLNLFGLEAVNINSERTKWRIGFCSGNTVR